MKVCVYSCRDFDERPEFEKISKELNIELVITNEKPTMDTLYLANGCNAISILTTPINYDLMKAFKDLGVEMISTRTIGFDHVDMEAAKKLNMHISNATYSPNDVADYAIMLMLMCTRKMKHIMNRADIRDFSLNGIMGRHFSDFTIGVIGTGRIGRTVIKHLQGFGVKVLCYDPYPADLGEMATYTSLDEIFANCDLITFHTPLNETNFHLLNANTLAKCKDGVIIINTARGGLIDSDALIDALASKKVGAAGLDVVEDEFAMYYYNLSNEPFLHKNLAILKSFPNVVVTPHMAFYTDRDVYEMVYSSLHSINDELVLKTNNPWRLI